MMDRPDPDDILEFWFVEAGPKAWFGGGPEFDARVAQRFGQFADLLLKQDSIDQHPWLAKPETTLALILVLDQFPRNIWRGSGKAFELDAKALAAARHALEVGHDLQMDPARRAFVYMPFMHSEDIADQDLCVKLTSERLEAGSGTADHARKHREVIRRFGRFPYRNEALGRASTEAEIAYLAGGGYAPGAKGPANSA